MRSIKLFFASVLLAIPTSAVAADPGFFTFGVGHYDIYQKKHEATELRAEYRSSETIGIFKPLYGVMGTSDSAFYGYGGVLVDVAARECHITTLDAHASTLQNRHT